MTAEQWAEDLIKKHGLPESELMFRALLELTFSQGQMQGMIGSTRRLDTIFDQLIAKAKRVAT